MTKDKLKLTLVTHKSNQLTHHYLDFISICARSGISAVQLREKHLANSHLLQFGKRLKALLDSFQIPLIVNDHLDLCLALDACGLHLGQDDGEIHFARKNLGPHKVIGLTVNTVQHIKRANLLPIDYIGVGAIFPTQNKPECQTIWGTAGLQQAASLSRHPIIAIGGINENNTQVIMQSGAFGIAAIGAFHDAINPATTAQTLRKIVDGAFVS